MESYRFKALLFAILMGMTLPIFPMFWSSKPKPEKTPQSTEIDLKTASASSKNAGHKRTESTTPAQGKRWVGIDTDLQISPDAKSFLLDSITFLNTKIKEAFRGSAELIALEEMSYTVSDLEQKLNSFLMDQKKSAGNDSDIKLRAAQNHDIKNIDEFSAKTIKPAVRKIKRQYDKLKEIIDHSNDTTENPDEFDESFQVKHAALKEIFDILFMILPKKLTHSNMGITPTSELQFTCEDLTMITEILPALKNKIDETIKKFKEFDRGISEELSVNIDKLTGKLNTIVNTLTEDLQKKLSDVIGYTAIINLNTQIKYILSNFQQITSDEEKLNKHIAKLSDSFTFLVTDLQHTKIHFDLHMAQQSLKSIFTKKKYTFPLSPAKKDELIESLQGAEQTLDTAIQTKGGLVALIPHLQQSLNVVVDRFADHVSQKFAKNVVDHSIEKLDKRIKDSIPKMTKKIVGYGIFGALAYTSLKWLYLKDKPTSYEWSKGLGGFIGSIACIPLVDTFINKCYPNT